MEKVWYVYMLRCGDDSLYTGISDDVQRRLEAHRSGKGAKYTRGRGPLELVYQECCGTCSDALRREIAIKRLPRAKKLELLQASDHMIRGQQQVRDRSDFSDGE